MATHCWIVERLSGVSHAKNLMYSRFVTFVKSLSSCEKPQVRALIEVVKSDPRCTTGSNLRDILMDTGVKVSPGETSSSLLKSFMVYEAPEEARWKIPLLESLIEIRDQRWEVLFDEENIEGRLSEDDVTTMINQLCID